MMSTSLNPNIALKGISTPQWILQSALAALSEGRISEVLDQFDDHFTFTDHALALEFTDKGRLTEFLHNHASFSRTPWWRSFLFSARQQNLWVDSGSGSRPSV